ncbi:MAG: LysE family translocator [Rhodospirillales bacterium]|nr:LysE family translocator [Rhodospirillales bacterium]
MNPHLFLAFCFAVTLLILMPGPIVTLVVANSLRHGRRTGLATVAGASLGNALLIAAAAAGLVAFFALVGALFAAIRWIGAAWLIWLGIRAWRGQAGAADPIAVPPRPARAVFLQGLAIALTNPKTIAFYIAFLPQVLDARLPAGPQLLAMSTATVAIATISDSAYALGAARLSGWFATPARRRLQGRVTGALLIGAGGLMLLVRRSG